MPGTHQPSTSSSYHITFDDVSKQVHHLRDVILWDIQRGFERQSEGYDTDETNFSNHLMFTKFWFMRISSVNKKRFCLVLVDDIPCAWTLSLILKSIWNCRPKDAVVSKSEATVLSCYDQTPMDHNRSAIPLELLVQVMESDRNFFRNLEPSRKAQFLSELLRISGGPIVWAVFYKAQTIFENYREEQLQNIQESVAVIENQESRVKTSQPQDDKGKHKDMHRKASVSTAGGIAGGGDNEPSIRQPSVEEAHRQLEVCLAQWASIIKSVKDSQKLEEVELSFSDGKKKRIWKVNRPKPEVTETVDYLQLLPQAIAKRILNFVPRTQLSDCARVNRYWGYLVDELKAEIAARLKIDLDIEKLTEIMLRHDPINQSMETFKTATTNSYSNNLTSRQAKRPMAYSKQASQKSGAGNVFKSILRDTKVQLPPIRNLAELSERLNMRGAADDNLRDWCKILLDQYNPMARGVSLPPLTSKRSSLTTNDGNNGIMDFGNISFPCPLMSMTLTLPLKPPLFKDPTKATTAYKKNKKSNVNTTKMNSTKMTKRGCLRYNLWSRDFSSLYTASKIASYKSPV